MPAPRLVLTRHAQDMLEQRGILLSWVEETVIRPSFIEDDAGRPGVVRAFRRIAERDNRMLRVAYVLDGDSVRILTVFFDRTRR
jgi:hypothetical protein